MAPDACMEPVTWDRLAAGSSAAGEREDAHLSIDARSEINVLPAVRGSSEGCACVVGDSAA